MPSRASASAGSAALRTVGDGGPVAHVVEELGCSRATGYKWLARRPAGPLRATPAGRIAAAPRIGHYNQALSARRTPSRARAGGHTAMGRLLRCRILVRYMSASAAADNWAKSPPPNA
ncbi:leucine zipper domain-containing protein [Actinoplanes sp. NPDC049596]|uniref:leucine zipper domain-containing protein n=1 Tax=unclassified Actinoplanes TaxID=2626549 RepID=UPI0034213613